MKIVEEISQKLKIRNETFENYFHYPKQIQMPINMFRRKIAELGLTNHTEYTKLVDVVVSPGDQMVVNLQKLFSLFTDVEDQSIGDTVSDLRINQIKTQLKK